MYMVLSFNNVLRSKHLLMNMWLPYLHVLPLFLLSLLFVLGLVLS
jgi:hypothetical protein